MSYKIGLDIGIASIGWAVMNLYEDEPNQIAMMGSRTFDKAEGEDGSSLALPRRLARSSRRRNRRHVHRMERVKALIVRNEVISYSELDTLYENSGKLCDIYEVRYNALYKKLDRVDFARLLIHLAQRRGFKSNRKIDAEADKETGKLTGAVAENEKRISDKGYKTVGEMLYKDEAFANCKRNKAESYKNTVSREMMLGEIDFIFDMQRDLGNTLASEELENKYTEIFSSQRSFDEGPGGNSPYGGNQIENMIGTCTFYEKSEKRAPKASFSSEYKNLLEKINNISIVGNQEDRKLNSSERQRITALAFKTPDLTYTKIRKEIALTEDIKFGNLRYGDKEIKEVEKTKFNFLKAYHEMRKALNNVSKDRINALSTSEKNHIGYALTVFKNDSKISEYLRINGFSEIDIVEILKMPSFSKFSNLSIKALDEIIPFLEKGQVYNEACASAGFNFKGHSDEIKSKKLYCRDENFEGITNPVVKRAISQVVKVVNAIIREMGESPTFISLEVAREVGKTLQERKGIEKKMDENFLRNDRIKERIKEEFNVKTPTYLHVLKFKLWEEQQGICAYSMEPIKISRLFEDGYAEIDHIVPYSLSFDDGYRNKVLVFSAENRVKGNRLPLQYIKNKDEFKVWTNSNVRDFEKRKRLLKEEISEADERNFKERNLNDTSYICRFVKNFIEDNLEFAPSITGKKKRVTAVSGAVTSHLRKRWGIRKIRADGDIHHAVDAVVIACTTDGLIKRVTEYSKYKENKYVKYEEKFDIDKRTGEIIDKFPLPWSDFRTELEVRVSNDPMRYIDSLNPQTYGEIETIDPIFVSRMCNRKVTGTAHKATILSKKAIDEGLVIKKVSLTKLKLDKNGEITNYHEFAKQSDPLLYNALLKRLNEFGGNAEKAFAEPFYKPGKNGTLGNLVKKVQTAEKSTLNVDVYDKKGAAANSSIIRVDVFYVEGEGYYMIPIYIPDTLKTSLPNKAIVASKSYEEWREMDDKDFIFSLHQNDLLKIRSKKAVKFTTNFEGTTLEKEIFLSEFMCYFNSVDISTGGIRLINHDNSYSTRVGVKTLLGLEKYEVDILGKYHPVKKEMRMPFNIRKSR